MSPPSAFAGTRGIALLSVLCYGCLNSITKLLTPVTLIPKFVVGGVCGRRSAVGGAGDRDVEEAADAQLEEPTSGGAREGGIGGEGLQHPLRFFPPGR